MRQTGPGPEMWRLRGRLEDTDISAPTLPLPERVFAGPGTSLGKRSFALLAGFVVLLVLLFAMIALYGGGEAVRRASMRAGGRFFSLPWLAGTLLAAVLSAVLGGVAALVAILAKGERSITMLIPLLMAGFVAFFAIAELMEG